MNFLEYSNMNQVNIIPQEEFEGLIHEVFGVIASNIKKSLGPLGSSATILDGMLTEATKDGYSILMKYRFNNRYKRMIYNLIKAPCTRMNNTVGDGTTTAIALTEAIFSRYKDRKGILESMYRLPRTFTKAWDNVIEELCEKIKEKAIAINPEDYDTIYNIAYVTSNGNDEISKAIASTYKEAKSPAIKQKDSPTNKSYIVSVEGFEFPTNAIDVVYVRNQDLTAEEKDVAVMVFDHKIETDFFNSVLININNVMRARGKKLIIVAPAYDEYMCETVLKQYVNYECNQHGVINMILTQFKLSDLNPHQTEDLAVVLRAKTITQSLAESMKEKFANSNPDKLVEDILEDNTYEFYRTIGSAAKVFTSCKNGCIFNVSDIESDQEYKEALIRAESELNAIINTTDSEKQSYSSKIYDARARLLQLQMKNYIYYIGADSDLQKQIIWDSIEDVIKCLRSAIKYGAVPGCQLSIIKACEELISEHYDAGDKLEVEIINIIYSAVMDVYSHILHGPDGLGMIKTIPDWNKSSDSKNEEVVNHEIEELKKKAIDKAGDIIKTSIETNKVFDLETLEFSDKIITSAETDVMVLTVASELIKVLISGNQCIFLDAEINESHQETMMM